MQFIVALIIVYGADIRLDHLGAIAPNGEYVTLGPLGTAVTIFGIMSVINAMNLIDGLDGLAGGLALLAVASLWFIFSATNHNTPDLLPVMTGGLAAFMLFNARWFGRKKAALFLGDAGSTLLGMLLVWLMVDHTQGSDQVISPVTALWLLAVPLIDFLAIVIRRAAMGRHPFHPDREHLHHILSRATKDDAQTVTVIHTVAFTCAVIGILSQLNNWPKNVMFYVFLGLFFAGFWSLKHSWRMAKLVKTISVRG
jgi:UDP-GlcNAc:undecaprenyl-phosphate GlcNAc-1-phosphate transferase